MSHKQTLVVIGNGMVGQNFLAGLVKSSARDHYKIVTFCEEPRPAYDRVHLTEYFSGKSAEDLSLVEDGSRNINVTATSTALSIDGIAKWLQTLEATPQRFSGMDLSAITLAPGSGQPTYSFTMKFVYMPPPLGT